MSEEQGSQGLDDQSQYGGPGAPTPVSQLEVRPIARISKTTANILEGEWNTSQRYQGADRGGVQHSRVDCIYVSTASEEIEF